MNVSVLCSDKEHPVVNWLRKWSYKMNQNGHNISLCFDVRELPGGDILFLISYGQLIGDVEKSKYKSTLVVHASDLPKRRGWSPYIWSILDGENQVTVSLLEASEPVDTGSIWFKTMFSLEGHELLPEINEKLFDAELHLMSRAVEEFDITTPTPQMGDPGKYMPKRSPENSRLDPDKTIAEQFNLLRVVDERRFPAFFDYRGKRYLIRIEKSESDK